MSKNPTNYWCEYARIDDRVESSVAIEILDGRFSSITPGSSPSADAVLVEGLTVPGLANAHSHAFHRALRSRTQADRGTFWTWRDVMYRAAARLQPDNYFRLARATFAEMALAGISCVGEFHYVHHQPDGSQYADLNEMGHALLHAAEDVGIRITLLDTLYLHGGLSVDGYAQPNEVQQRFSDGSANAWAERVSSFVTNEQQRIGAAIHSVRGVDPASIAIAADWAARANAPLHAHVSEQIAENEACGRFHHASPVKVLAQAGALSDRFTAVHATHLDEADIASLADAGSMVCMCPTTERDLGDGIGPTAHFADCGVAMALGSDSHAVIDILVEAQALELDERLRSQQRGIHSASDLLTMATINGHRSLGWSDAGVIAIGSRADMVTVRLDSVRTSGADRNTALEACIFAATASDVTQVVVDGVRVVAEGQHRSIDVAAELRDTIKELFDS